jgi:hypothetical protein
LLDPQRTQEPYADNVSSAVGGADDTDERVCTPHNLQGRIGTKLKRSHIRKTGAVSGHRTEMICL